jgi:hypothetical protein
MMRSEKMVLPVVPKLTDWMVERVGFELAVPIVQSLTRANTSVRSGSSCLDLPE